MARRWIGQDTLVFSTECAGHQTTLDKLLELIDEENTKLKRLVADLSLDQTMPQDVLRKNGEARAAP